MTNSIRKSSLAEQVIITNYPVAKVIPEMDFYAQAIKLI
jgi:hypothetical protein